MAGSVAGTKSTSSVRGGPVRLNRDATDHDSLDAVALQVLQQRLTLAVYAAVVLSHASSAAWPAGLS